MAIHVPSERPLADHLCANQRIVVVQLLPVRSTHPRDLRRNPGKSFKEAL